MFQVNIRWRTHSKMAKVEHFHKKIRGRGLGVQMVKHYHSNFFLACIRAHRCPECQKTLVDKKSRQSVSYNDKGKPYRIFLANSTECPDGCYREVTGYWPRHNLKGYYLFGERILMSDLKKLEDVSIFLLRQSAEDCQRLAKRVLESRCSLEEQVKSLTDLVELAIIGKSLKSALATATSEEPSKCSLSPMKPTRRRGEQNLKTQYSTILVKTRYSSVIIPLVTNLTKAKERPSGTRLR